MAGIDRKKPADEVLALALASGEDLVAAAKMANISERTARRRAADPAFRCRVDELRQAIVEEALGKLTANATKAADTFSVLLSDPNSQVKLAAARAILDYRSRLRADGELLNKVNELETLVKELTHGTEKTNRQDAFNGAADGGPPPQGTEDEPVEGSGPDDHP
jgi:hypothetical protein